MDIEEMKTKVDEIFKEHPLFETTMSKNDWVKSEEDVTCYVIKVIRRTYSKVSKIRKRKLKTSDISKIMLESIVEISEEW
jgi:hypothetical protein